jgi:hypothetical protein
MEIEVVRNIHRLIVCPSRQWAPGAMERELNMVEDIVDVGVQLITREDGLVYSLEVQSEQTTRCVAELVRGRLEYLEALSEAESV